LGFDIPDLRRRRPEVVVCSISGFGQTGEWATVPAHGMNLDCLAGTVATRTADNGEDEIVQAVYVSLGQVFGALNAVIATTAAIVGARATGEGAWIDISCWDALMEVNSTAVAYQAVTGRDAQVDMGHMWGSMHRIYRAKDGVKVFVALIEQKFWQTFCNEVDRQDLIDKWQDHGGLDYGDMALVAELEPIMASRTGAEWESFFLRLGLPASPIYSTQDVIDSAHFETRGMLEWTEGDPIPNVASGIRWIDSNGDRPGARPRPAPSVGQHTDEVLSSWLGQG
jgi:crotonobetainyl-CoA:carnitine CoA-transferase CaiB-like acyl-CoA transferase